MVILQAPTGFSLGGGGGGGGRGGRGKRRKRKRDGGGRREGKRGNFKRGDNRYLPVHIHVVSCLFIDHIIMLHNVPQIEGLGQQERLTDPRATPSLASDPSPAYMYMYVI